MSIANFIVHQYLKYRYSKLRKMIEYPLQTQARLLQEFLQTAKQTEFGKIYDFSKIKNIKELQNRVPIQDYESLKPYFHKIMYGTKDVLWAGETNFFSKSSGTTNDKSKFIPVSATHLETCLLKGPHDAMTFWYHNQPNTQLMSGKSIIMGGSKSNFEEYPKTVIGDVSALMLTAMPAYGRYFHVPSVDIATMPEWEAKIQKIAEVAIHENITNIGGVPTWTLILFKKILEMTGKNNILEVWNNFELYMHGGVSFLPYREEFKKLLPSPKVQYREIYNASEGFFGVQNDSDDGMLLLLDNGIVYEFIPSEEWDKPSPQTLSLEEIELDKNYELVINTNSGLWRYRMGDTIKFVSTQPYKIKVTGRTKHFINAFGEEVMVENTDKAIALTCEQMQAQVAEYTVAPIYLSADSKGGHEWLIEFTHPPHDTHLFAELLDKNLQKLNSDYEAKRYKSMALKQLTLKVLPLHTFYRWLKAKGKYGGQHKVPRLSNHRDYVEQILLFAKEESSHFGGK